MPRKTNNIPRIGCAGWNIPAQFSSNFASEGTHLQRYATQFSAVEINSSFYRLHRSQTYARWAESVPDNFRFSVKIPKQITHELRLRKAQPAIEGFLETVAGLGSKLAVLLVQLPPSLKFERAVAGRFFDALQHACTTHVVCEPRHASWFSAAGKKFFTSRRIGLVIADPSPVADVEPAAIPGTVAYYRLHGSPQVYYSRYGIESLKSLSAKLSRQPNAWCIFDNTAAGWATQNAMELRQLIKPAASD